MQAWSAQPIDGTILGVRLPASWRMSVRADEHERLRFGRFSSIAKSMAFWAFYTGAIASASIASFSIVRGGRDAKPVVAGIRSDAPRGSEAMRCRVHGRSPGGDCRRHESKDAGADSDDLHPTKSSRLGEADAGVAKPLQQGAAGVRETVPAARRETKTAIESQSARPDRATDRYGGSAKPRRGQFRHAGYAIPLSSSPGNTAAFGRGTAAHGREAASCSQGQAKSDRECADREFVGRVPLTGQHR